MQKKITYPQLRNNLFLYIILAKVISDIDAQRLMFHERMNVISRTNYYFLHCILHNCIFFRERNAYQRVVK